MEYNSKYPLKHLSIRVPWHDNKWNGTVCNHPKDNDACLVLKTCALKRKDEEEVKLAGKSLKVLNEAQYPACVVERATFMYPHSFSRSIIHPYSKNQTGPYKFFTNTILNYPPFSAAAVPYNWMLPENAGTKAELYDLDFLLDREPYYRFGQKEALKYTLEWTQAIENQKSLLNCFFEHVKKEESLCFFYAKEVPFVEASGRVIVGIGSVLNVADGKEYAYNGDTEFHAMAWEHMISHSIRPDEKNGFLLPYHEALEYQKKNPQFDPAQLAVIVPSEYHFEFSYATEHASHDSALYVLRECVKKIELAQNLGIGKDWSRKLKWLHDRISEVEELRGDYPGMGSALCAFGFERGHFIAQDILNHIDDNACPWEYMDLVAKNPEKYISGNLVRDILSKQELWHSVKANKERLALFQLLSRFNLTIDQAIRLADEIKRGKDYKKISDGTLLENPYLIYEISINSIDPISLMAIDNGLMLNRGRNLLPNKTKIYTPTDKERIRALTVFQLERATNEGHTLLPQKDLIKRISSLPIQPQCDLSSDHFNLATNIFEGKLIQHFLANGEVAFQLKRLDDAAAIINETVKKRISARRHHIEVDWAKYLSEEINFSDDEADNRAKNEKVKALQELANARFSVLIGPAGSGKTTLLNILATLPPIQEGNVLMLAPTGKAKVRMEAGTRTKGITAKTIAQFLHQSRRFKGSTQTYHLNDSPKEEGFKTVIIDESSMLTEEMLAATIQNLKRVERLILVGDYRQLPPIGAGRPFVDIINFIKPQGIEKEEFKIGLSYVELTGSYRQKGSDRLDLAFANLFSGGSFTKDKDEIFTQAIIGSNTRIQFEQWKSEQDLERLLLQVLERQLEIRDEKSFNESLGSANGVYFNKYESAKAVDDWQILSPVKSKIPGTTNLNRFLHQQFKCGILVKAQAYYTGIPKPVGNQEIVYGDKVINLINKKKSAYPKGGVEYIANGEIGLVIGQSKPSKIKAKPGAKWSKPSYVHVEFSSQIGHVYSFTSSDFKEEGDTYLELAYALTIHKAQGSQFNSTILIIPDPCLLLSRELIYTALTRQKDKVIVLYQGNPQQLYNLTNDFHSNTLQRITNLFYKPDITKQENRFYEKNLIHCASDGTMLRSKSEVIIYETLRNHGLDPEYEYKLELNGEIKRPDFFIEDDDTGEKYYWEHLGMLGDPTYCENWQKKQEWYYQNDIKLYSDGGGRKGILIVSKDDLRGGISVKKIEALIKTIFRTKPRIDTESLLEKIINQNLELRDAILAMESKLSIFAQDLFSIKSTSSSTEEKILSIYQLLDKTSNDQKIVDYQKIVKDDFDYSHRLAPNSLNFLTSAYYLIEKLEDANALDYSPYIIQYSRAIENELLKKLFLPFYSILDVMESAERETFLRNEFSNNKSGIFAKMLNAGKKEFTLGMMEKILSFIWNPGGKTLNASPLLIKFRDHVVSQIDKKFLTKETVQQLNDLTQKYRNKAAHIEPIPREMIDSFTTLCKEYLTVFLNCLGSESHI